MFTPFAKRILIALALLLGTGLLGVAGVLLTPSPAPAVPSTPVYTVTFSDGVTGDNAFIAGDGRRLWTVDPGADSYSTARYERPTIQTYEATDGQFATSEYLEYVDIVEAKAGFDSQFLYIAINLRGRHKSTSDGQDTEVGLVERYGFRISNDPAGRFGLLIVADQPELKNSPNTVFGPLGTFGYHDTNGDVGDGSGVDGYDEVIISDGKAVSGAEVLWVRLDPSDNTVIEFALDYTALGFTENDLTNLGYLEIEAIKGGPKDPASYLWNATYTASEAGSPNPGVDGLSEFGTQGLGNIYELDTVRGGALGVPLPPDPGEAGKVTLEGIDSDGDGVRDDIQRYIALTYPDSEATRAALSQYASAQQESLLDTSDRARSILHTRNLLRAIDCLYSVRPADAHTIITSLEQEILNTPDRTAAQAIASAHFSGEVVLSSDPRTGCDFDPDTMEN